VLRASFDGEARRRLQATGGDDYELCFSAPASMREAVLEAASAHVPVTRIGRVVAGTGVSAVDRHGMAWARSSEGFRHFE